MKLGREKKNIVWVLVTNCMILAVGIISAFFLPKYVSVATYAQYKTYTLYVSYLGCFHLGFNNGIYLKYGNLDYKDIPYNRFKGYTRFLFVMQIIAQIILFGILGFFTRDNYFDTPFFYIVLNLLAVNVRCYFSYINLFTKRFKLDCIIQLVNNILNFSLMALLLFIKCNDYQWYLIAITAGNFIVLFLSMITAKEITFDLSIKTKNDFNDIADLIKSGFMVMLSEYMGLIILGIDSIMVNRWFDTRTYSMYAFAITLINAMFQVVMLCSKLIFPYLSRGKRENFKMYYSLMIKLVIVLASFLCGITALSKILIPIYLDKYNHSIPIIIILGATLSIKCIQELVFGNFYKVMRLEKHYLLNNFVILVISLAIGAGAYLIWHEMFALAYGVVLSYFIWFVITNAFFAKQLGKDLNKFSFMMAAFLTIYFTCMNLNIIGMVIYYCIAGIFTIFVMMDVARFLGFDVKESELDVIEPLASPLERDVENVAEIRSVKKTSDNKNIDNGKKMENYVSTDTTIFKVLDDYQETDE